MRRRACGFADDRSLRPARFATKIMGNEPNGQDHLMRHAGTFAIAAAGLLAAGTPALLGAADAPLARVLLKDGQPAEIGGNASIVGTNGAEDVTLRDEPGQIEFDGSFNRGNDTIRLPGDAAGYTVRRVGSRALLTRGERSYSIPVGAAGIPIVFADAPRTLIFRTTGNAMFLGSQPVTDAPARVSGPVS